MKTCLLFIAALFIVRASCAGASNLDFGFDFPEDLSPTVSANQVLVFDWNNSAAENDSRPDFVILDRLKHRLTLIYQTATGVSEPITLFQFSDPPSFRAMTLLRIGADEQKDLVVQDGTSILWWELKANQPPLFQGLLLTLPDEFTILASIDEKTPPCIPLDFDQDGRDDLLFQKRSTVLYESYNTLNLLPALQTSLGQFTLKVPTFASPPIESGSFTIHHRHSFTNSSDQTELMASFHDISSPFPNDGSDPETKAHTLVYDLAQNQWQLSELPDTSILEITPIDLDGDSFPEFLTHASNTTPQTVSAQKLGPDGNLTQLWQVSASEVEDVTSQRYYQLPTSVVAGNFDLDPEQELLVSFPLSEEMFIVEHDLTHPSESNIIKLQESSLFYPPSTDKLQDTPLQLIATHDLDEDGFDELVVSIFVQDSSDFIRINESLSPEVIAFSDRDAFPPCDPSLPICLRYPSANFRAPLQINSAFFPGKMIITHTDEDNTPDLVALNTVNSSELLTWRSSSSFPSHSLAPMNLDGFRGSSLTRELHLGDRPHPLVTTNQGSYSSFFNQTYEVYQKSHFNSTSLEQSHDLSNSSGSGLFPPHTLAVADFDQDLLPDLLEIDSNQGVIVCRFGGSSGSSVISLVPYWIESDGGLGRYTTNWIEPHQVLVADPDNDGDLDIFMSLSILGNGPVLYRNNGDRTFSVEALTSSYAPKAGPLLRANMDNNGIPDLIFLKNQPEDQRPYPDYCEVVVLPDWGTGQGYTIASLEFQSAAQTAIATGDLNGDGLDDFVFGIRSSQIHTYFEIIDYGFRMALNTGEGSLGETIYVPTNLVAPEDLLIHDLDQDGRNDVLLSSIVSGSLLWLKNLPITSSPNYSEWASSRGLSEDSQTENPDRDQLSNLEEWYFGTEPLTSDSNNIPQFFYDIADGEAPYSRLEVFHFNDYSYYPYNFSANTRNDVENEWILSVEFSDDLVHWNPLSVFKSMTPGSPHQMLVSAFDNQNSSNDPANKRFYRHQLLPAEASSE
ncbi:MAG: FG-GAP repeat domain-containing protein [Roseibacillus sp.]